MRTGVIYEDNDKKRLILYLITVLWQQFRTGTEPGIAQINPKVHQRLEQ